MAAGALVGYRLVVLLPGRSDDENTLHRKLSLFFLMVTSAACIKRDQSSGGFLGLRAQSGRVAGRGG